MVLHPPNSKIKVTLPLKDVDKIVPLKEDIKLQNVYVPNSTST